MRSMVEAHNGKLDYETSTSGTKYFAVTMYDPDTGQHYVQRTNNHGWRDRDRTFINHTNSFRILVLGDSVTFGATVPAEKD